MDAVAIIEPFVLVALNAAAANLDEEIEAVFAQIGDRLNDRIEGTGTELDDYAKGRLVAGLKALVAELEVEGVDD